MHSYDWWYDLAAARIASREALQQRTQRQRTQPKVKTGKKHAPATHLRMGNHTVR